MALQNTNFSHQEINELLKKSKRIFFIKEATSKPEHPAKADNISAFGRKPSFVPPTSSAASIINEPPGLVDSNCMFPFHVVVMM